MSKPNWGARDWNKDDLVVSDDCFKQKKHRSYIVEDKTENYTIAEALSTSTYYNQDKKECNHEKSKAGTKHTGFTVELVEERTAKAWW